MDSWLEPAPLLIQIIALHAEGDRELSSLPSSELEEEADESAFWLELIIEGSLLRASLVQPLLDEANELTRFMAGSRVTASRKTDSKNGIARKK